MDVPSEDREVVDREYGDFTERAGTLIHHFFGRVWNEGKVELTELMWSPDIVFHSPLEPGPLVGRERLLEHVYAIQNAFSDLHFDIEDKIAEGDRVVLRVTQTGSHTGDYFGLPPGGRRVEMPEIFIFRASPQGPLRARVEEIWLVLNALSLLQQMGYFPRGSPPRALFQVVLGFQKVGRVFRRDTNPAQADARATAPGGEAPGPRGIGYLPRFVRDPPGALMEARERYGDVVKYRQGPLKGYLIFHPDELKHVFADRVDDYGHGRWVTSKVRAALGTNVFTLDGDAWRRRRAMLEPEFTPDRVARFAGPIVENATRTVERWEGLSDPVDVVAEMEDLSRTNAGRAIFGADWDTHSDVVSAARPIFIAQSGRELNSPLGLIPLWMPTPFHRRFRAARAAYDAAIARMIERRREGGGDDLLAALVAARDEKTGQGLSDGEIRDEATTLFFLWKPVAITLAWVWWLLGQNAAAADRLRAEVSTVLDGPPSLDDVERLPYVRAVVDEALRLYPPGLLQPREAFADDELRGSPVPAGTRVVMCPYVTHRHPEFWEDAEAFDPERFLGARELPPFAFSPLGEPGPRRCLGYHIARLELPLVVATIARRCRLRPVPGQSVATSMGVAMDFARPLMMELSPV